MHNKINVIQFVPYYPPHKGGLETHAEEWASWWTKKQYGEVITVTGDLGQNYTDTTVEWIEKDGYKIGYKKNGYITYLLPAFDLIHNFPIVKCFSKQYRLVMRELSRTSIDIVMGRTRFFLSSLHAGIWAKLHKKKWVHIEHGSDFVLLESAWKTKIAYLYDQTIGRCIFHFCDAIVSVSAGSREFLESSFGVKKDISVIYRGLDLIPTARGEKTDTITRIGFVGRVVKLKGVDLLLEAFSTIHTKYPNTKLQIVGDGDALDGLRKRVKELGLSSVVDFLGEKSRRSIIEEFLPNIDILANPSWQEGLPTSVIEGIASECIVVATDVGGTREISQKEDLILVEKGNISSVAEGLNQALAKTEDIHGLSKKSGELEKFNWENNIALYHTLYQKL